jgi:uncharacterized protein (DUF885 family)
MDSAKRLEKLEKEFFRDWVRRHPFLGTSLGFHDDYDEVMPDGTLEKELDDHKFLHRMLGEFEALDVRKLSAAQEVERDLAIHLIKNWLFDREVLRIWECSPEAPQLMGYSIFQILSRNYAPLGQRMRSIMKRLEKLPKYIDQSRSKLRTPSKVYVEIELETITRLPGFFNIIKDIGREHLPVTPQRDLNRLIDHAQNALERYSDWLIVDVLPDCREEYGTGEEKFKRLLHVRGIDASPGQLVLAAEAELSRVKERQKELARTIRRKVPVEDVRDMIKQQHPENFDGVLRYVRDSVTKSRQFVTRSKFAAFPEGEQLFVIETPTFFRHLLPFGGYWAPARFESKLDGYYFVTPGDCDSDKLKEHHYAALTNMTIHQGYPGRHLQLAWATRHPSVFRALTDDGAMAEGWGLYCEERAKEMGYDDTPPSRFGQLQAAVLAAVRVIIDVKLSTGRMLYQEAIETLIDHLGMDRICAEAEVRRYVATPGAQVAPFWGRERIKDLKKWAREKMTARFSETFFHTALLQCGPIPYPLLRRDLELRILEELRKPVEKPKEEHRKEDRKHVAKAEPAHAPPARPATRPFLKPAPPPAPKPKSKPKAKPKPAPAKARRPAPRRPSRSARKPVRGPARRPLRRPARKGARRR